MSAYPLDEPHLAALRWAATFLWADPEAAGEWLAKDNNPAHVALNAALRALSSPSSAAQLVRDLLGACGVTTCALDDEADARPCVATGAYRHYIAWEIWTTDGANPDEEVHAYPERIPALILALLDALAKPEGREEAALKALREAGR